jgi:hypothetical protein
METPMFFMPGILFVLTCLFRPGGPTRSSRSRFQQRKSFNDSPNWDRVGCPDLPALGFSQSVKNPGWIREKN